MTKGSLGTLPVLSYDVTADKQRLCVGSKLVEWSLNETAARSLEINDVY